MISSSGRASPTILIQTSLLANLTAPVHGEAGVHPHGCAADPPQTILLVPQNDKQTSVSRHFLVLPLAPHSHKVEARPPMLHWHQMDDAHDSLFNFSTHLPDGGTDWQQQRPKMVTRAFAASALHLAMNLLIERTQLPGY